MMRLAFPLMLVAGVMIGLAWPAARRPAPRVEMPPPAPIATSTPSSRVTDGQVVIPRDSAGHFVTAVAVNGVTLPMLVDTGSDTVALTVGDARAAHITVDPATFTVIGRGASGGVRGIIVTLESVAVGARRAEGVRGAVVEGLDRSLLGRSYLERAGGVTWQGDGMRLP